MSKLVNQLLDGKREKHAWRVIAAEPVSGGCISQAARVTIANEDGQVSDLFWKQNQGSFADNFRCERAGLERLRGIGKIRTPEVLGCGEIDGHSHLLLEWISRSADLSSFQAFGRQWPSIIVKVPVETLVWITTTTLERVTRRTRPLTIGLSSSSNDESSRNFVLLWMLDCSIAKCNNRLDVYANGMNDLLTGRDSGSSLLHGDLWEWELLFDELGTPVWIDPAVYFGCREAEFGMLMLFGNCPRAFYDSYQETWPLPAGWQRRTQVYVLYHLLNHLNLFGSGYLLSVRETTHDLLQVL